MQGGTVHNQKMEDKEKKLHPRFLVVKDTSADVRPVSFRSLAVEGSVRRKPGNEVLEAHASLSPLRSFQITSFSSRFPTH